MNELWWWALPGALEEFFFTLLEDLIKASSRRKRRSISTCMPYPQATCSISEASVQDLISFQTEERRRRIPQVHSICSISEAPVQDLISFQRKKKKKKKNSACIIPKSMFSDSAGIRWSSISRRRVIMCCYSGCQASLSIFLIIERVSVTSSLLLCLRD